ncbi:efflux RND transporter permease subunit [Bacillus sp. T33-2]|uniref:efflux RND transporter permease subunit n=1 Tax=Bacillus sp. T33-2 TaxID=2054168 RepID=UPI000C75E44C|nr:efflux RND transporter permease subunit [Bacillus sp. T33-2]PLR97848.1 AcrB/AcrD/AcrF family protein [Bacillus sp. T33-2]
MSWFTKWAFRNKAAVTIMSLLILLMGVVSYTNLPMEFFPAADQPQISVVVLGQGSDSETMEKQVTSPIEKAVSGVKGKRVALSTTGDGFSKIDLFFEPKTVMKDAKLEIQEAVNELTLPPNVSKPTIVQLNTSMIPISEISVTFEDGLTAQNIEFAESKIVPQFKDIKGVANVQSHGKANSYVSVKTDNVKMAEKQVTLQNIMGVLQGQSLSAAVGEKTIDGNASNIKVIGNIDSIGKLKNLQVAPNVALQDVANIQISQPDDTLNHINGEDGLFLIVTKDSTSNAVSISKEVDKVVKKLNKEYDQAEITVVLSTADMVETSVHSMIKEVLLGALFATIVIMLFLRNLKSTFITIVSIPLSLCFTLYLLSRSGITLNVLTLGGVAVAVGRLVDDSIVVIENIFRKMQKEKFSVPMVMEATREVGAAITSSTLTTVAVFLPIGLVSGGLQEIMLPFALTITYSLLASLIVALTVVPLMSAGLLKNTKMPEHKPAIRFSKLVTWSLNHKFVVIAVSFLLFAGSIGGYFVLPKGTVDSSTADFVMVNLSYPNETPLETVKENSLELEEFIVDQKEVKHVFTQMGNSAESAQYGDVRSPTQTTFTIIMDDKKKTDQFVETMEKQKANYEDAQFTASAASMITGYSTQITIDVLGNSIDDIEETAQTIKKEISEVDGVEKVTTNFEEKKTVYSFTVDPEKANSEQLSQQLGVMLNRTPIGSVELDEQQTSVILEPMLDPKTPEDLETIPVMTTAGIVPVSEVAELNKSEEPTSRFHKDGDQYVRVTAAIDSKRVSEIDKEINRIINGDQNTKGLDVPDGVEVNVGGASAQQADDFTDLFITMMVSIGVVFIIMVITFKTIRAPIAILFSLPLAAVGAILGLLISRIPVDITALLGALMLIGIVVTNAIVLLDRIKQNEQKMIIRDAIVEAAAVRMRPIVMTAVATIFAMVPLLFKKAESGVLVSQSLAVVVIGGLAVATMLTLVVIPVVYELLHFKKSKTQRLNIESSNDLMM